MSSIVVRIPTPLRPLACGANELAVEAPTVRDAFRQLESRHAALVERVLTGDGSVRPFVNVFVNSASVKELDGLETALKPGDVVSILPAVAGGARPSVGAAGPGATP